MALVLLFFCLKVNSNSNLDEECFIANVGDCRGVMSSYDGKKRKVLTDDHRPCCKKESKRIAAAGGRIYRSTAPVSSILKEVTFYGPERVLPGKLSVSRTIGDIYAKDPTLGGNPKVIIPDPDCTKILISNSDDFIILGSEF